MFMYGASHGKDKQVSCGTVSAFADRLVQSLMNALRNASVNLDSRAVSEPSSSFRQRDAQACGQALRDGVEGRPDQHAAHTLKV